MVSFGLFGVIIIWAIAPVIALTKTRASGLSRGSVAKGTKLD